MTVFLIILGILLAITALLLWFPIGLQINTRKSLYCVNYGPLIQARLIPDPEELLLIQMKVLFWKRHWSVLDVRTKQEKTKKPEKPETKNKTRFSHLGESSFSPSKIRRLLRTFRIREFHWELDTGSPVLNAKLFPVFFLSDYRWGGTDLNFEGRNSLALRIENRPIRILTAWIHP